MAAVAELTDTISVAADAISTNFELQHVPASWPLVGSAPHITKPVRAPLGGILAGKLLVSLCYRVLRPILDCR